MSEMILKDSTLQHQPKPRPVRKTLYFDFTFFKCSSRSKQKGVQTKRFYKSGRKKTE